MGHARRHTHFHTQGLGLAQKRVLRQLGPLMTQRQLYLGGGTALALYFGHRRSVDLDWFTERRIPDALRFAQEIGEINYFAFAKWVEKETQSGR